MTAVDTVSAARPRLRRDVLFTQTPTGVLFHDANGGFHLRSASAYRFVSVLVPYLDGSNTVQDLCAALGEQRAPMVSQLVANLIERGFARDVSTDEPDAEHSVPAAVAQRFDAQLNYVDHYTDRARSRFAAFRSTRVAVLGEDTVAQWCALGLLRNGAAAVGLAGDAGDPSLRAVNDQAEQLVRDGVPASVTDLGTRTAPRTWADLNGWDVVVCAGPAAARQALSLLAEGVPDGRVVLPVTAHGDRVVVGPLARTDADPCVACAALRLGANRDPADAADFWLGLRQAPGAEPGEVLPPGPLGAMIGNLLAYEIFRLRTGALAAETDGHVLVQDVHSLDVSTERLHVHPECLLHPRPARRVRAAVELGLPHPVSVEDHDAAEAGLAELTRRTFALVTPHVGVATAFDDDALTQTPLKISRVRIGLGHRARRTVTAVDLHTVLRARLAALDAAALVYADHVGRRTAPVDAGDLDRALTSAVTATGLGSRSTAYTDGVSLLDAARVAVPLAAVHPGAPANRDGAFVVSPAGAGAGDTWSEAVTRGLLSALAYDAVLRVVRGAAAAVPAPPSGEHPEWRFLVRSAANVGLDLDPAADVLVVPGPAPVVLVRAGGLVAARAAFDPDRAAIDALTELVGRRQLELDPEGGPADLGGDLVPDLDAGTISATVTSSVERPGPVTGADVLAGVRAAGLDAVAVDTTPSDLYAAGLHTARVVLGRTDGR